MTNTKKTKLGKVGPHHAARPMRVVVDKKGYAWLCDQSVNSKKDLRKQGCWACGGPEMAFTRND